MEKVVLSKGGIRKEFSPKAAEIARENFGWVDTPDMPNEIGQFTRPIPIKRKIEPPEVKPELTPSEPVTDAKQPEVIHENPKVKRARKK